MPLGQRRQPAQRLCHGVRHLAWPQTAGQRPYRLDRRQQVRPVGGHHMFGMRDGAPAAKRLDLAGDQQLRPDRHLPLAVEPEEHQVRRAGAVLDHHAPGLALVGGRLDALHLDGQRGDLAEPRLGDSRALAAVHVGFRQVEQQVDHPLAARRLGDQRADRRADALQRGQRREQRGERIVVHGLTCG